MRKFVLRAAYDQIRLSFHTASAHSHRSWCPTATAAYPRIAADPRHQYGRAETAAVNAITGRLHFAGSTAIASISINAPSRASF